jgi:hypothetical protein
MRQGAEPTTPPQDPDAAQARPRRDRLEPGNLVNLHGVSLSDTSR